MVWGGSAAFYTLAAIAHVYYMFMRGFAEVARWAARVAFAVQTAGVALLIAETGRAPVHTLFEFAYFFTWFMMAVYIGAEAYAKNQAAGSFLVPSIAGGLVVTVTLPKPSPEQMLYDFPAALIGWHVGVMMLGYAFLTASFVAGALYLIQERNLRRKKWGPIYYRLPSLEWLDVWSGRMIYVGFSLVTIGMTAGLIFAHVTWSSFWESDPKVIFTVFVWLVYGAYGLMRNVWGWGGRKAAWWAVIGVLGLIVNYFIINLVSELHRFGV